MNRPWDADASKPGALNSLDVLVRWLLTPDNYKKWVSEEKKPLAQEIVDELEKQETSKRSPASIRRKFFSMEQKYKAASAWLKKVRKLELYLRGKVDEKVELSVLRICPMYRELTPVFQPAYKDDDDEEQDNAGAEDDREDSDTNVDEEPEPAKVPASAQGKRKRASTAPNVAEVNSSVTKRGKQEAQQRQPVKDARPVAEKTIVSQPTQVTTGNQAFDEFGWGGVHHWNQYYGAKYASSLGQNGDEMAGQLFQREMEHTEALAKLQLEAERKRQEVHINCDKALSRQKLRNAGISEVELNSIIPE